MLKARQPLDLKQVKAVCAESDRGETQS